MKPEYKPLYEKLGLNVVYYRKRKKLTQMQLAELADIDRSHISAIELGNVGVSFDVIFKLCEVLEVKPRSFLISEINCKKTHCNAICSASFYNIQPSQHCSSRSISCRRRSMIRFSSLLI